jgi:hypothetical protein
MTQDPIARAFEAVASMPPLERGFLQHVLMQALSEPKFTQAETLAEHLRLVPQVLRAIPLEPRFLRNFDRRPGMAEWMDSTVRSLAMVVAAGYPTDGASAETLEQLSQISLRDSRFVANFLENREAADLVDEAFLEAWSHNDVPSNPVGIDTDALPNLDVVRVLEVRSGSVTLVELKAESRRGVYLGWVCGDFDNTHETLIVKSDPRSIAEYLGQRLTTRDVLKIPSDNVGFLISTPIDVPEKRRVRIVAVSQLPPRYLPTENARHSVESQPDWDEIPQSFLVEDNWSAELFHELERNYLNVFALTYFLDPTIESRFSDFATSRELDGYQYGNLYSVLRKALPANENARATDVAAASPGVLTISASKRTAERVGQALLVLNLPAIGQAYTRLHEWSRLNEKDFVEQDALDLITESAYRDIRSMADMLSLDVHKILPAEYTPVQLLRAGKLVASYYRQLAKLADPPKGVEFVSPPVRVPQIVHQAAILQVADDGGSLEYNRGVDTGSGRLIKIPSDD